MNNFLSWCMILQLTTGTPTATENEVDDLLLAASQAYKAEEASERQTEEPPTATENGEHSAMISCLELRKPCYVTTTTGV